MKHGLGDWVAVNRDHMPTVEYTSSCYYYQAQRIAAEIAKVKGLADEAKSFDASARRTLEGLRGKYMKPDGVWDNGGQTAQGMALAFGLLTEAERPAVEKQLVASVERADGHVDMGLFGTKHVFRALSRAGRTDLAWKMLTNPTSPSPVDWMRKGGTTLWEDWGDGSSRNHIMFGDFVGWAYQYLAGIGLPETAGSCSAIMTVSDRGFRKVVFAPCVIDGLDDVAASVKTSFGTYESSWIRKGDRVEYRFVVSSNGEAVIRLPGRADEVVGPGVYVR